MKTPAEIARLEEIRAGAELGRLAAHILKAGESGYLPALEMAMADRSSQKIQHVLREAVGAGSLDTGAALTAIKPLSDAFLALLRGPSLFDNLAADALKLPPNMRALIASGGGVGAVIGEAAPAPLLSFSLSAPALEERKAQAIVAVSGELLRMGGAVLEATLNRELRDVIARTVNKHFLSDITPTGSPSPDIAATGNDAEGVLTDIAALLAALDTDADSRVHLAMHPDLCKVLALLPTATGALAFPNLSLRGGSIGPLPVTATRELAAGEVMAIDAARFAVDLGTITIDRSDQANLQFDSEPDSEPDGETVFKSLWQLNMVALRVDRRFSFRQLTPHAVAKLTGATIWGTSA